MTTGLLTRASLVLAVTCTACEVRYGELGGVVLGFVPLFIVVGGLLYLPLHLMIGAQRDKVAARARRAAARPITLQFERTATDRYHAYVNDALGHDFETFEMRIVTHSDGAMVHFRPVGRHCYPQDSNGWCDACASGFDSVEQAKAFAEKWAGAVIAEQTFRPNGLS